MELTAGILQSYLALRSTFSSIGGALWTCSAVQICSQRRPKQMRFQALAGATTCAHTGRPCGANCNLGGSGSLVLEGARPDRREISRLPFHNQKRAYRGLFGSRYTCRHPPRSPSRAPLSCFSKELELLPCDGSHRGASLSDQTIMLRSRRVMQSKARLEAPVGLSQIGFSPDVAYIGKFHGPDRAVGTAAFKLE